MNSTMIYVCADDYGLSEQTCKHIDECAKSGALNKISVFPNSLLSDLKERVSNRNTEFSLHINLVEGRSLAKQEEISLLVDDDGRFKCSFAKLLLLSLSVKRKEFEKQIYNEIKSQLMYWQECIPSGAELMLDSHQHTHMIPLIFRVLMRVISDEGIDVKYIRIPAEPVLPYMLTPSLYFTYSPVNLIKQWLLKLFSTINRNELKKSGIGTGYFMGILFSGKMDEKRVCKVLPHYLRLADKNNRDIEILFHPGYSEGDTGLFDECKKSFKSFYLSEGRKIEFDTVKKLNIL